MLDAQRSMLDAWWLLVPRYEWFRSRRTDVVLFCRPRSPAVVHELLGSALSHDHVGLHARCFLERCAGLTAGYCSYLFWRLWSLAALGNADSTVGTSFSALAYEAHYYCCTVLYQTVLLVGASGPLTRSSYHLHLSHRKVLTTLPNQTRPLHQRIVLSSS